MRKLLKVNINYYQFSLKHVSDHQLALISQVHIPFLLALIPFLFVLYMEYNVLGPTKRRGPTKMVKVHARTAENKVVIRLNEKNQPVADNQKVITELSNFVGTLARDNVSLTYVNWHVVPDSLKKNLWEQTLVFFITLQ